MQLRAGHPWDLHTLQSQTPNTAAAATRGVDCERALGRQGCPGFPSSPDGGAAPRAALARTHAKRQTLN
jgi:hypothetical protein